MSRPFAEMLSSLKYDIKSNSGATCVIENIKFAKVPFNSRFRIIIIVNSDGIVCR